MDNIFNLTDAVYAILIAFFVCVVLLPAVIPMLRRLNFGQQVRDDGPKTHLVKQGTPTMGGIAIVLAFVIASLFFLPGNGDGIAVVLATVGFGIVGFADDYIKKVMKRSLGLKAKQKLLFQLLLSGGFLAYMFLSGFEMGIYIPFVDYMWYPPLWLYIPFYFFVMLGIVNAVNLTDGVDGLCSGVTVLVTAFFMFVMMALDSSLLPIAGAAVGALMAFLLFNSHPAKIFMGDTGSFALGGFIITSAVLLQMPLVLGIVGIIYVVQNVSVIIQVNWFKFTKRRYGEGRRVFKMAPIHHHFELSGMKETQVVAMFYVITALACLVGFLAVRGLFIS